MPIQERDFLYWFIAEHAGRIVAAAGYQEDGDQWTILDWYCEDNRLGKLGSSGIVKLLFAEADDAGKTIYGVSCFTQFVEHALKRGCKFLGIAIYRPPGGRTGGHGCHQPLSPP